VGLASGKDVARKHERCATVSISTAESHRNAAVLHYIVLDFQVIPDGNGKPCKALIQRMLTSSFSPTTQGGRVQSLPGPPLSKNALQTAERVFVSISAR